MDTTDWIYDFGSLPLWDIHEKYWDAHDRFFELPQSDTLCCIYSIFEVTMCNCLGRLAILQNKANPQLVAQCSYPFRVNFSASQDGNLLFLSLQIYDRATNRSKYPILILDIPNRRFSYITTKCSCPGFKVVQVNHHLFVVEADERERRNDKALQALHGKKIRTKCLRWHDLSKLDTLHDMVFH